MKKKVKIQTSYLSRVYEVDTFTKVVNRAIKALKAYQKKHAFDAIAFTGTSGAALAYPLSYKLGIPLICIRKRPSDSHSYMTLEGCVSAKRYVIVDDLIQSGATMRRIQKHVKLKMPDAKLVGILLYDPTCGCREWHDIPLIPM
jgi:adenine/guanine phosphoribosyltransferase-like PRPP-binding protein